MTSTQQMIKRAPGLMVAALIAGFATLAAWLIPVPVSAVLLAVLGGLLIANMRDATGRNELLAPGAGYASRRILRIGIVLLGAQLSVAEVIDVGAQAALLVLACMVIAFTAVAVLGRVLSVGRRETLLIGVGTAICGNTAIMATSPIIKADERQTSYAVGTITLLGTLGLLLFPIIGRVLDVGDTLFGLWVGLAINDTSQVVAAGAAYSEEARDVATIVKLFRNALMAPVLVIIAVVIARRDMREKGYGKIASGVKKSFPVFVLGFLALAAARSVGLIPDAAAAAASQVGTVFIVIAIAGVGLSTKLREIRTVGPRPLLVGALAAVLLAVAAFVLARVVSG